MSSLASVAAVLRVARGRIAAAEAKLLLRHVLGCSHASLDAHPERELAETQRAALHDLVERRRRGEPIAYLVGVREFYGREFRVSPAVLIPRPETELLVDLGLEKLAALERPRILDLGTGSGALGITLALERQDADVMAVDASAAALGVASENAKALGATIRLVESDWFSALRGESFDLIVANPPYVAESDPHLEQGDVRFEPRAALAAGADGLDALRRIAAESPAYLNAGGWFLTEHGFDQAARCRQLLVAAGFSHVMSWRDLAGIERVSGGCRDTK